LFVPLLENGKIDCIAIKNDKILRFQIKLITYDRGSKKLPVRKISHNQGEYKVHLYTADEIDYFVGADIEEENLYICPISFISNYKSAVSVSTMQPYKNNFSQLEPLIRNN
jgi:hypothetical protein